MPIPANDDGEGSAVGHNEGIHIGMIHVYPQSISMRMIQIVNEKSIMTIGMEGDFRCIRSQRLPKEGDFA
jgi:hypothetical protein